MVELFWDRPRGEDCPPFRIVGQPLYGFAVSEALADRWRGGFEQLPY
jgi:hypothetical protein